MGASILTEIVAASGGSKRSQGRSSGEIEPKRGEEAERRGVWRAAKTSEDRRAEAKTEVFSGKDSETKCR